MSCKINKEKVYITTTVNKSTEIITDLYQGKVKVRSTIGHVRTKALNVNVDLVFDDYYSDTTDCRARESYCGNHFKTNLHQYIFYNKELLQYTYIDEMGEKHVFTERYYYINNNSRIYVPKVDVEINGNGNLSVNILGEDRDITVEYANNKGWQLMAELQDIDRLGMIEQRHADIVALEDKACQIEDSILNADHDNKLRLNNMLAQTMLSILFAKQNTPNIFIKKGDVTLYFAMYYINDKYYAPIDRLVGIGDDLNYIAINYSGDKIVSLSDDNGKLLKFEYENGLLSGAVDGDGCMTAINITDANAIIKTALGQVELNLAGNNIASVNADNLNVILSILNSGRAEYKLDVRKNNELIDTLVFKRDCGIVSNRVFTKWASVMDKFNVVMTYIYHLVIPTTTHFHEFPLYSYKVDEANDKTINREVEDYTYIFFDKSKKCYGTEVGCCDGVLEISNISPVFYKNGSQVMISDGFLITRSIGADSFNFTANNYIVSAWISNFGGDNLSNGLKIKGVERSNLGYAEVPKMIVKVMQNTSLLRTYEINITPCTTQRWRYIAMPVYIGDLSNITSINISFSGIAAADNKVTGLQLSTGDCRYINYTGNFDQVDSIYNYSNNTKEAYNYSRTDKLISILSKQIAALDDEVVITKHNADSCTSYAYNAREQIVSESNDGMLTEYEYSDMGMCVRISRYNVVEPAMRYVSESKYNEFGEVIADIDGLTGEEFGKVEYCHNCGDVLNITDSCGAVVGYGSHVENGVEYFQITSQSEGESNTNTTIFDVDGNVIKQIHNGVEYGYSYDNRDRVTSIKIADNNYYDASYVESADKRELITSTYANDTKVTAETNTDKQIIRIKCKEKDNTEEIRQAFTYDDAKNLHNSLDNSYGLNYAVINRYDSIGNLVAYTAKKHNVAVMEHTTELGEHDRLASETLKLTGSSDRVTDYCYSDNTINAKLNSVNVADKYNQCWSKDSLGRMTNITTNEHFSEYGYLSCGNRTSEVVSRERHIAGGKNINDLRYEYDSSGNIIRVRHGSRDQISYSYDMLGRLVREDNRSLGKSYTFDYDRGGNIVRKSIYNYTIGDICDVEPLETLDYTYPNSGWRDQLSSVGGQAITYDAIGNPTGYKGALLNWRYGRQLASYGNRATYVYTADNLRQFKQVKLSNGSLIRHIYTWHNGSVVREQINSVDNSGNIITISNSNIINADMHYYYGNGGLLGFTYQASGGVVDKYSYIKNSQGDITHILDSDNNVVACYVYDAWGNHKVYYNQNGLMVPLSDAATGSGGYDNNGAFPIKMPFSNATEFDKHYGNIASLNPFRYRGYYYDVDTCLYYLQSRYYDAQIGRFINADDISYLDSEAIGGLNLYAYCGNNPVMAVDPSGHGWNSFWNGVGNWFQSNSKVVMWTVTVVAFVGMAALTVVTFGGAAALAIGAVGFGLGVTNSLINQAAAGNGYSGGQLVYDTLWSMTNTFIAASGITRIGSVVVGAATSALQSVGEDMIFNKGELQCKKLAYATIGGAVGGLLSGVGAKKSILKYKASYKIYARTVANRSKKHISRQFNALMKHSKNIAMSLGMFVYGGFIGRVIGGDR